MIKILRILMNLRFLHLPNLQPKGHFVLPPGITHRERIFAPISWCSISILDYFIGGTDTDTNQIGTVFKKYLSISCIDNFCSPLISLFFVRPTTREACNFRYRSIPCWRTSISVWLFLLILGKSLPAYLVTSCTYFVPFILDKRLLQPVCALTVLAKTNANGPVEHAFNITSCQ